MVLISFSFHGAVYNGYRQLVENMEAEFSDRGEALLTTSVLGPPPSGVNREAMVKEHFLPQAVSLASTKLGPQGDSFNSNYSTATMTADDMDSPRPSLSPNRSPDQLLPAMEGTSAVPQTPHGRTHARTRSMDVKTPLLNVFNEVSDTYPRRRTVSPKRNSVSHASVRKAPEPPTSPTPAKAQLHPAADGADLAMLTASASASASASGSGLRKRKADHPPEVDSMPGALPTVSEAEESPASPTKPAGPGPPPDAPHSLTSHAQVPAVPESPSPTPSHRRSKRSKKQDGSADSERVPSRSTGGPGRAQARRASSSAKP